MLRSVSSPPDTSRRVILRFDDNGERDCAGFYWAIEGCWYKSDGGKRRRNAVHPSHWVELTDIRYEIVSLSEGRTIFSDCTFDEAQAFVGSIPSHINAVIVPTA